MRAPDQGHNSRTLDPDQTAYELEQRGMTWADANAAADALEEAKKSILSEYTLKASGRTQGERQDGALASPEYREHLARMVEARRAANRARVRYDSYKVMIELERSRHATERAAMALR